MRIELFLVATLLCSALGHPSQINSDDVDFVSSKSSSKKIEFEAESSSSSRTEVDNDTQSFDYESTAKESSHSSANSQSEFTIDTEQGDTIQSSKLEVSNLSSFYENSKTEFEEQSTRDVPNSVDDDSENSYFNKSEKSQKSSSSSSSYKADSTTLISDDDNDGVQQKSSSFTEEKEVESESESETKQSLFVSKDVFYNAEELQKSVDNIKSADSLAQGTNTRVGIPQNSSTKGIKTGVKKSKSLPKVEKALKTFPKTATGEVNKPSKTKSLPVGKKSTEEVKKVFENEGKTSIDVTKPTEEIKTVSENEERTSNELTKSTVEIAESSSVESQPIVNNLKEVLSSPAVNEKPHISTICQTPHEEVTQVAEKVKSFPSENKNANPTNNIAENIRTGKQMEEHATLSDTKLPVSLNEITSNVPSVATPQPCKMPENHAPSEPPTSSTQNTIPSTTQPLTSTPLSPTSSETIQATSISETTSSENKQFAETNTLYNGSPELYTHYPLQENGNGYPTYPMYSQYEKSPFLAPLDQFPYGHPCNPPYLPQPPNMNFYNWFPNLYPLGYIPPFVYGLPRSFYDWFGYNPCSSSPMHPQLGHPQSPSLPSQKSTPIIPSPSLPVVPVTSNLPVNSIPDTTPTSRSLPENSISDILPTLPASAVVQASATDIAIDSKQAETEIVETHSTIPASTQPAEVPPSLPITSQQPLTPSQELMIKNRIPPYIIADLEERFEEAKTSFLQKYTVYPEDITTVIESADEQTLCYDYLVLGTQPGALSALKTLTETGKRVLILDDARIPPSESYSPYHRPSLIDSSYVPSYLAKAPETDIEKKIFVSKIVGGPLSYDVGVWDHGAMQKFEQWGQTCKLWSWETIASYYMHIENVEDIGYMNGPINVCHNAPDSILTRQIIKSFEEVGIREEKYEVDSARREPGLILLPSMYDRKVTMNFAEKMFAEVKGKENLHMALGLQAVKIIFESERAVGVEVVTASGQTRVIRVTEELIVAYGVVNTVKVLQQSGFGDASLLQQHQIPVLHDLPQLGKDVLLYPMYPGMFIKCSPGTLLDATDSDFSALGYVFNETSMQPSLATSFYKAFLQVQGATESNIQINVLTFSSKTIERLMYFMKGLFSFNQETIDFVLEEVSDHDIMFLMPQLLDVEARAQISISSADHKAAPLIDTHLFESDMDMLMMQKTLSIIKRVSKSSVFKEVGAELVQIPVSECGPTKFSKEFNECSIRALTVASLHLTGGAAMGVDEKTSVVNEQLLLRGTQNVRLFNTAVIPHGLSADSSAICSVIGRYGADIVVKKV